jgi:hypothetical protein
VTVELQFPMKKLIQNVKGITRCAGTGYVTITAFVQHALLKKYASSLSKDNTLNF